MITIAFFNNKGGIGQTSLVYHLARMYGELGCRVLAADLDPQANLTVMALEEERLEGLWSDDEHPETIYGAVQPLFGGTGDIRDAHLEPITERVALLVGDLALARLEDDLSTEWPRCLEGRERAFRVTSAFWRLIDRAARSFEADVVLIDVGPNLGAINRAALIAASHVVVPVAPDLLSLQGLRNLGPVLRQWRETWSRSSVRSPPEGVPLPLGEMTPIGYVLMQHAERLEKSTTAYERGRARISEVYRESVLKEAATIALSAAALGVDQITRIKHFRSLMPLALDARKPMFLLKPADGAIGAHQTNVLQCYSDYQFLAEEVARRTGLPWVRSP